MKLPDRISALPEPIIHHILSRLPSKYVKLASSLSKTWYDFCLSFPYLDFDVPGRIIRERYLNYISETLHRFHERNLGTLIRRIGISITLINSTQELVFDNCVRLALDHGVEKIDLEIRGISYNLPRAVFSSSSIRVIKLQECNLLETFRHGDLSVSCSKLRKLHIRDVSIDERALKSLISNCPLMEKLEIDDARGIINLCISRLLKLKRLRVFSSVRHDLKMVEVDAPMLHFLELLCSCYCLPYKIGILECPRLAILTLGNVEVENFRLEDILSRLPFLSSLRLTNLSSLTKFKISNDSLSKLAIIKCRQLVELEIEAPNLLSFEFESDSVPPPLVAPMHTIMGQSYITIDTILAPSLFDNFVVKVRNFVSRLDHVNYLRTDLFYLNMINVEDLEERVLKPLTNIEELKIIVDTTESFHDSMGGYGRVILVFRP